MARLAYVAISQLCSQIYLTCPSYVLVNVANSLSPSPYVSHTLPKGTPGSVRRPITFETSKEKRIFGIKFKTMEETARDTLSDYEHRGW